jgi:hypothetical protein
MALARTGRPQEVHDFGALDEVELTRKLHIARTKQRIAILLIETLRRKSKDVSEHRRVLAAEERFLASGLAPPQMPGSHTRTEGTALGYIMPPGAK